MFVAHSSNTQRGIEARSGSPIARRRHEDRINADLSQAPRVWRENRVGAMVRVIDPRWLDRFRDQTPAANDKVSAIIEEVAAEHCVSVADIMGKNRTATVANARMHAIYEVARLNRDWTQAMVAKAIGLKDRQSVVNAIKLWPGRAARLGIRCEPMGPTLIGPAGLRARG